MKEEITSQKNYSKSKKKCDSEGQGTFAFILFTDFEQVFVADFRLFFLSLNIDHKHKCIEAKTLETQES